MDCYAAGVGIRGDMQQHGIMHEKYVCMNLAVPEQCPPAGSTQVHEATRPATPATCVLTKRTAAAPALPLTRSMVLS